jgi:hypothetical protein
VKLHIKEKRPMSELKLDLTWTRAKVTLMDDLKKALVEVATPANICSSWQKASLTRCTSEALFVEANKILSNMNQHIIGGTMLPKKVDDIMDDEEQWVLCKEDDQGLAARHRLCIAGEPIPPWPRHTRAHSLRPCAIARPFGDALPCRDSAWIMQPPAPLPQAAAPGSGTWARHLP